MYRSIILSALLKTTCQSVHLHGPRESNYSLHLVKIDFKGLNLNQFSGNSVVIFLILMWWWYYRSDVCLWLSLSQIALDMVNPHLVLPVIFPHLHQGAVCAVYLAKCVISISPVTLKHILLNHWKNSYTFNKILNICYYIFNIILIWYICKKNVDVFVEGGRSE